MPPVGNTSRQQLQCQSDLQKLVLACNKDGMESLQGGNMRAAFEQLKYAEALLIANPSKENNAILAVTCSNLGCYYKRSGKLHAALCYLRRALSLEVELGAESTTIAGTHLNICAILSRLEKHDKALQHAFCAQDLIGVIVSLSESDPQTVLSIEHYTTLVIAYHNVAVEREYLQQWDQAAMAYKQGYEIAQRCLGPQHPLTKTLANNCSAVLGKAERAKMRGRTRTPEQEPERKQSPLLGDDDLMPGDMQRDGGVTFQERPESRMDRGESRADSRMDRNDSRAGASSVMTEALRTESRLDRIDDYGPSGPPRAGTATPGLGSGEQQFRPQPPSSRRPGSSSGRGGKYSLSTEEPLSQSVPGIPAGALRRLQHPDGWRDDDPTQAPVMTDPVQDQRRQDHIGKFYNAGFSMDTVNAEKDRNWKRSPLRSAPTDYRPNRVIKGSSRTSILLRKHGHLNDTTHRDLVIRERNAQTKEATKVHLAPSFAIKYVAAQRIQRVWRQWHEFCQNNAEWMHLSNKSAVAIQGRWRTFHYNRVRLSMFATKVQRRIRGYLVRLVLRRNNAVVNIQRHVVGFLCRMELARLNSAAVHVQRCVRGWIGRLFAATKLAHLSDAGRIIQRAWHAMNRRIKATAERLEHLHYQRQIQLALACQRFARGKAGRKYVNELKAQFMEEERLYNSASKIQSLVRRDLASKYVHGIRRKRLQEMHDAATFVRKLWLSYVTRRRYIALREQFTENLASVMTVQRYSRGFLVRLRMWRNAVRCEQELWSGVEIQRMWRGYLGRKRWEEAYELYWSRVIAAARLQKAIRGWLAFNRVWRLKQQHAFVRIELARKRYEGAVCIQKRVRGVLCRIRVFRKFRELFHAATIIQRLWRGHCMRQSMWELVLHHRATFLQSHARRFLVQLRRKILTRSCLAIQECFRKHLACVAPVRIKRRELRDARKAAAATIQVKWRSFDQTKNEPRAVLRDYYRTEREAGGKAVLDGVHRAQLALEGVYKRLERNWSRAATVIQRAVRCQLLCLDEAEVKRIGKGTRVQAPIRGTMSEGTSVNSSYPIAT